jgi:hypothetical protein
VARDPGNTWLSGFPRNRLDAEAIRDTLLVLGGDLDPAPGGAHPFPGQADWNFTQHNPFKAVYDSKHRSVYLMTQRIQRHPYLAIFDGADPSASTAYRTTSTTPLQALFLLNDPFVHEQSQAFAARIAKVAHDDETRLMFAYEAALGRPADRDELDRGLAFLAKAREKLSESGKPGEQVAAEAWQAMVRALFRLNEFVYVD